MQKVKIKKQNKNAFKKRSFKQFDLSDRTKIEIKYKEGLSFKEIAQYLGKGRNASSVSREVSGKPRKGYGKYQAHIAQNDSLDKRKNKKLIRLKNDNIRNYTLEKLKLGWSPEQISIRLPIDHPKEETISHEAIYQYIYAQIFRGGNGNVKKDCEDLRKYLTRRHSRRTKKGFRKAKKLERLGNLPSIEDRPKEVERRKEVGHWEGDTLVSRKGDERVKSTNERKTGIVFFKKTINGTSQACNQALVDELKIIPSEYLKTLTQDRGTENYNFQTVEKELKISCYFAHPYCSYERGSNENLNGLFRRYFPKGTDFAKITNEEISKVEYLINSRPRKRFKGLTPYEMFYKLTGVAIDS